ncbi:MAG: dipeptide ABC transporter ATP-binding protein [Oscillospiraceae bacterium]|nr:dipeptide ABC transporter ATP-binding protein [Oscillospiraceae bacterium]
MNNTAVKQETLLEVKGLTKYFPIQAGVFHKTVGHVKAVDDVSFTVKRGKTMGLVGESGCGKSTTGRVLLRLLEPTAGEVSFAGNDVFKADKRQLQRLRTQMQIIFQDPYSSLNPRLPVREIVGEAMLQHGIASGRRDMNERVIEVIGKCGLFPEQASRYPHQFSGGQRQRICIARALAVNPEFVVCDEAVSALDVSIQSQIINLLKDMQDEMGLTYLFISHDLSVVKFISDDVGVMYLGQIVEYGGKQQIFENPAHPYTEALLSAAPSFDPKARNNKKRIIMEGDVPSPANPPPGCRFHTRCPFAKDMCKEIVPENKELEPGHFVMCHKAHGLL